MKIYHIIPITLALVSMQASGARVEDKLLPWPGLTLEGTSCEEHHIGQGYGPFDYMNPIHRKERLPIVEKHHFNDDVKYHRAGLSGSVHGDLVYTVRAFPNHFEALASLVRLHIKKGMNSGLTPPVECFIHRARFFKPEDRSGTIEILYGFYLHRIGQRDKALEQYQLALRLRPKSAELHYNLGLLYIDLNKLEEARVHAEIAYKLGYPLRGLKNRLLRAEQYAQTQDQAGSSSGANKRPGARLPALTP